MGCVYTYGRGCSGPCVGIDRMRIIYNMFNDLTYRSRRLHASNIRPVLAQLFNQSLAKLAVFYYMRAPRRAETISTN